MSNTTQKNTKPDNGAELTTNTDKLDSEPSGTIPQNCTTNHVSTVSLVLSIIAMGGISYIIWHGIAIEKQLPDIMARTQQLDAQLTHQYNQLNTVKEKLSPIQQQVSDTGLRGERLLSQMNRLSNRVKSLEGTNRISWHLAEIEYLLRLANQRLLMSSDILGAKNLLISADDMLLALDDYDLYSIREALAEDLAVLKSVPEFDQEGLYMQLQALNEHIKALPIFEVNQFNQSKDNPNPITLAPSPQDNSWQAKATSVLSAAWTNFTDLFRFTSDRELPIDMLATPAQESMIRQHLILLIEQSKLALMSHQQVIYQDSIKQARKLLRQYFYQHGIASRSILKELSSLAKVSINSELPSINRALEALKHYLLQSRLHMRALPKQEQGKTGKKLESPEIKPLRPDHLIPKTLPEQQKMSDNYSMKESEFISPIDISVDNRLKPGENQQ
ncbi:MAG: uroporphyrinogen-III C-methyltransferase [Candidatus Endonucleobacter bathymodioli]|uniref:Uroporphyrinogen-III C-methyltransferase n=1 Tax=Candidatus Endonucleibacter bathymodioli TaxID=539814 RepID=A0AA90SU37_9GAMM|nr:uroporphyrinogen-III C-methyltransferase [Candidatus Endonucleobacter bathymodioli]